MKYIELNTGINIPVIGSGTNTFGKSGGQYMGEINGDTTELADAIALGYRHFDTAVGYRNESVIGRAVKESGIKREDFFITSKIPGTEEYSADERATRAGVEASLKALDMDYIDLYLIHHPWDDLPGMMRMWRALENYVDQGVLKAIGVSNFGEDALNYFEKNARVKPAVNQIESHPGKWNTEMIAACLKLNIVPEAWGPLTRVSDEAKSALSEIGSRYGKTWAQVILRYQIEQGIVVIPKSHNRERQAQNLDIFDFELTDAQRQTISKL